MKKPVALFLVCIFLFNVIGYYGVYAGMISQANKKADEKIENKAYDQAETITIKIPLTLPYPIQNGVERLSGAFEHQGEFYKLVEQRYENDTVYVVCLKDNDEKKAVKVFTDLVKQSTDQSSAPNQNTKVLTGFLKDFNPVIEEITLALRESIILEQSFKGVDDEVLSLHLPVLTPPPNTGC